MKKFDLNIEKVLEHWNVAFALREIIANAFDERSLSKTSAPQIFKDEQGNWHIRDFGRGLRYEHFTQNENKEKLKHPELVIGKFGVGLKDALATFDRKKVKVTIRSKYADITIGKNQKHGFDDIVTLHAIIHDPSDPNMLGTDFVLSGVKDEDIEQAKDFFLQFSGDEILEKTSYGSVLRPPKKKKARIYVNGLFVAEEENFLFSYNITSLNSALRKALNRERTNVGRGAYTDRVKSILLSCTSSSVADALASDLKNFETGRSHHELQWTDVQLHACKILNASEKAIFLTPYQMMTGGSLVAYARNEELRVIVVPESIAAKLPQIKDIQGQTIRDLGEYAREYDASFEFSFVSLKELTDEERKIFNLKKRIMAFLPKEKTKNVKKIMISETMKMNYSGSETVGLWESDEQKIIIKRSQLQDVESFAGTLLHEITHAFTDADDVSFEFEDGLTELLGQIASVALKQYRRDSNEKAPSRV